MNIHIVVTSTAKLESIDNSYGMPSDWVILPEEYQDKFLENISTVLWDDKVIIMHPELVPQLWFLGQWVKMECAPGTKAILTQGLMRFEEPRQTPTEQRDAFQKNNPHLVKDHPEKHPYVEETELQKINRARKRVGQYPLGLDNCEPLPKVIQDQLDVSTLHYRKGKIQPWDFITSQGMSFLEGNVVKYLTRYKHKNGLEDLKKARTYLDKLIFEVEKCPK